MRNKFKCSYTTEPINHIEGFYEMVESGTTWNIHHRLVTHRWSKKQQKWVLRDGQVPTKVLKALGLYYNRPASELIYLSPSDHQILHCSIPRKQGVAKGKAPHNKGKSGQFHHSEETKAKISEYQKTHDNAGRFGNRDPWNKGTHESGMKGKHHSEESKRKSSESNKLVWAKRDRTPDIWINNGIINRRIKITEQILEGFVRGRMRK